MKLKRVMRDWLQRSAWAGASLTVALGAGSASAAVTAPTCTAPTLQECQADGYLQSTCGQMYAQRCDDLIEAAFTEAWNALTEERVAKLPAELGGGVSTVRVSHHQDPSTIRVDGGAGTYVGTVLKNQLLYRKRFTNLNDSDQAQNALLTQWNTNGEQLTSCEEYVYEKYYDYSRFEDRLGRYGTDYRAIFNVAYASDGIANRELKDRSGSVLTSVLGSQAIPKNLYFLAAQGPYPEGSTAAYTINPELLARIPTAGRQFYTPSWSWHQQMSSSLQGYNDDELNQLFEKQQQFAAVVERRNAIWARYESDRQTLDSTALRQLSADVAAQLRGLDMEIEAGLQDALAQGCLGLTSGMRCDWSPKRFKALLDTEMIPRREADFQRCLEITGNDFGTQSFVHNAGQLGISGLEGDYSTSVRRLNTYLSSYKRWLDSQATIVTAWTKKIRRSFKKSDSGGFGDSDVGASYAYGAGWEFNSTTSHVGVCESFDSHANAYLTTKARFFGTEGEIFYASGDATAEDKSSNTGDETVGYAVVLRVVGSDIYTSSGKYPATFSFSKSKSAKQDFLKVTVPIPIMGIPLTVSGSIVGSVGIKAGAHGGISPGCRFTLGADVMPWAKVDATVAVALDVGFASAGVSGSLTLIGAEVPAKMELAVFLDASTSQAVFQSDAELAVTLRALDGSIKLFLDVILLDPVEVELFSFTGATSTLKLEDHKKVPLGLFL